METKDGGSVTGAFIALKNTRDEAAVGKLWGRYLNRLLRLARNHLSPSLRGMADEEDVALSAFDSFCAAAAQGRFPCVGDRDDLWKILVTITVRKAADYATSEKRRRPNHGRLMTEADFTGGTSGGEANLFSMVSDRGPSPEFAAMVVEEFRRRLASMETDRRRQIALDRMEGYKDHEIARRQGCSRKTVQRELALIRRTWEADQ